MDKMDNTPKARKYGGLSTMDNDPKEKITGDGMDKSYFARCQKILREWGAPLSGWHCQGVYDVREDDMEAPLHTCELCGCRKVRFVHVMRHPGISLPPGNGNGLCGTVPNGNAVFQNANGSRPRMAGVSLITGSRFSLDEAAAIQNISA